MAKSIELNITEIKPVSEFQRNTKTHIARLRKTKQPMVLTVNGSAAVVVQDAETYQELLDYVHQMEERDRFVAAVNEGLADLKSGRSISFEEFKKRGRRLAS